MSQIHKNSDPLLSIAEHSYRLLFEESPLPMWVFDSQSLAFLAVNDTMVRQYGYTRNELMMMTIKDIRPQEDVPKLLESLQTLGPEQEYAGIWRHRKKDGTIFTVELYLHSIIYASRAARLVLANDITKRLETEDLMRKLSHIVEFSDDAIISETLDGIVLSWNLGAERIYGYASEEIVGKSIETLLPPEMSQETAKILNKIKNGERVDHFETIRKRKDGKIINISLMVSPIKDSAHKIIAASMIARDITERINLLGQLAETAKQREMEMRQYSTSLQNAQENERQRIARELHDDLGQRLTSMKLKIQMLEDEIPRTDKIILNKLRQVIKEIDTSLAETRRISSNLYPSALDIFGLVPSLNLFCKNFGKDMKLSVNFKCDITEQIDKHISTAIYRISQEALSNIAKHSRAKIVLVHLTKVRNVISLSIEDNGVGFDHEKILESRKAGYGFGLMSIKERTELIGGWVQIESSLGKGTRIDVRIPLISDETDKKN